MVCFVGRSRNMENAQWWGLYYSGEVRSPRHYRSLADLVGEQM